MNRHQIKLYAFVIIISIVVSFISLYLFEGFNKFLYNQGMYFDRLKEGIIYYLYHS